MFLKRIDLLSPSITLYTNNKIRHSSIFSGILTITTYSILIATGCYFILDLIQRKTPSAFYFNRYIEDAGFFSLNSNSMFNFIQILDTEKNLLVPFDYDSFRIYGIREYIDTFSTSNRNISEYEHWLYGNCNNDSDINGISYLIKTDDLTESVCIRKYFNKEEKKYYNTNEKGFIWPSIDKGVTNPNLTFYGIIIEQCRNDSLKNDCKPIEEIEKYAATHAVGFQIIDHYIDIYNYEQPLIKYFYNIQNGIFSNSYTTNHLNFNPATVKTHNGYFFDKQIKDSSYFFVQNEKVTTSWGKINKGIYDAFYFWMQNRMQYYERTYERVQSVLADISGVCNAILFIATILNKLVSRYITILDTEDILIKSDHKLANIIYNNENNFLLNGKKTQIHFDKWEDEEDRTSQNIVNNAKKIENSTKSITDKNLKFNQSIITKNTMSNNYLMNNNKNLVKVINKEKEINKQNLAADKKKNTYQPIKKISFNFVGYLQFIICNQKNKILIYEKFRRKILCEEHIIQNYMNMYKLLNMSESQFEDTKGRSKYRMSRILSSLNL